MVARSVRDAEVVGSNPVASTKTGLGRILRPFFMIRTTVIYILVNSLVLTFEKRNLNPSARFGRRYFYLLNQVRQTKNLQDKKLENVMFSVFFCALYNHLQSEW